MYINMDIHIYVLKLDASIDQKTELLKHPACGRRPGVHHFGCPKVSLTESCHQLDEGTIKNWWFSSTIFVH